MCLLQAVCACMRRVVSGLLFSFCWARFGSQLLAAASCWGTRNRGGQYPTAKDCGLRFFRSSLGRLAGRLGQVTAADVFWFSTR